MILFVFILFALTIFTILLFKIALYIVVTFDSDKEDAYVRLLWLEPFIKVKVSMKDASPFIEVYVFNRFLFKKLFKYGRKKHESMDFIKLAAPTEINVNTRYGFRDPYITGITCGAVNAAAQLINIDSVRQIPDFMADRDYIYLDASAKVNIGSTLVKMLRT